jgi:Trp operon repressor
MTVEVWRPVVGWEQRYQVSNCGRVRSLDRLDSAGRPRKGKLIKPFINEKGCPLVSLWVDAKAYTYKVSQLVAAAFLGPANGRMVLHWDDVKEHNHLSNLRYGTSKENHADMIRNGIMPRGTDKPSCKLSEQRVLVIRRMMANGVAQRHIAKHFGVSEALIRQIKTGERWSHV